MRIIKSGNAIGVIAWAREIKLGLQSFVFVGTRFGWCVDDEQIVESGVSQVVNCVLKHIYVLRRVDAT